MDAKRSFQVVRECLAQGQRAMNELGWTQRDVMVQSTLGQLEEQHELLHDALCRIYWCGDYGVRVEEMIMEVVSPEERVEWKRAHPQ